VGSTFCDHAWISGPPGLGLEGALCEVLRVCKVAHRPIPTADLEAQAALCAESHGTGPDARVFIVNAEPLVYEVIANRLITGLRVIARQGVQSPGGAFITSVQIAPSLSPLLAFLPHKRSEPVIARWGTPPPWRTTSSPTIRSRNAEIQRS